MELVSVLIQRLHKLGSCSKAPFVKLCDRLVQITDLHCSIVLSVHSTCITTYTEAAQTLLYCELYANIMNYDLGMARTGCFVSQPVLRVTTNPQASTIHSNAAGETMKKQLVLGRVTSISASTCTEYNMTLVYCSRPPLVTLCDRLVQISNSCVSKDRIHVTTRHHFENVPCRGNVSFEQHNSSLQSPIAAMEYVADKDNTLPKIYGAYLQGKYLKWYLW